MREDNEQLPINPERQSVPAQELTFNHTVKFQQSNTVRAGGTDTPHHHHHHQLNSCGGSEMKQEKLKLLGNKPQINGKPQGTEEEVSFFFRGAAADSKRGATKRKK